MKLCCRIPLANFELEYRRHVRYPRHSDLRAVGLRQDDVARRYRRLARYPDGEIEIDGRMLFSSARGINLPPQQRGIGYVPQEGALFPHLSVRKNILFGAERVTAHRQSRDIKRIMCSKLLEIASLLDRPVTKVSGGEAQRVALARAILSRPRIATCWTNRWRLSISA